MNPAPQQTNLLRNLNAIAEPFVSTGLEGAVFAIDPGPQQSGYVVWDNSTSKLIASGVWPNAEILKLQADCCQIDHAFLAIEMIESFGMAVGKEVFETVLWVGRFQQAWPKPEEVRLVYRKEVKRLLCGTTRATSANIRQALIDRFGSGEAIGNKKTPGPLYGVKSHAWSALAVAITAWETK